MPILASGSAYASGRYANPHTAIPADQWPEVQARYAAGASLRTLARHYGVSPEAVRGVVQRRIQAVA